MKSSIPLHNLRITHRPFFNNQQRYILQQVHYFCFLVNIYLVSILKIKTYRSNLKINYKIKLKNYLQYTCNYIFSLYFFPICIVYLYFCFSLSLKMIISVGNYFVNPHIIPVTSRKYYHRLQLLLR